MRLRGEMFCEGGVPPLPSTRAPGRASAPCAPRALKQSDPPGCTECPSGGQFAARLAVVAVIICLLVCLFALIGTLRHTPPLRDASTKRSRCARLQLWASLKIGLVDMYVKALSLMPKLNDGASVDKQSDPPVSRQQARFIHVVRPVVVGGRWRGQGRRELTRAGGWREQARAGAGVS
jgi:hypothetical protein